MPRYTRRMQKKPKKRGVSLETLARIGRHLRWLREALGIPQAEWARRMGISVFALNKWEAGTKLPNINALITICDASGASMDYLVRGLVTADMAPELVDLLHRQHAADLVFRVVPPREQSKAARARRPRGG